MTALVLEQYASSNCDTSTLYCGIVISTNTGTAPYCIIGATVVGKPAATVITSSSGRICLSFSSGDVNAINANKFADEPEFTSEQNVIPKYFANCVSNSIVYVPDVSQNSNDASTRFCISFLS